MISEEFLIVQRAQHGDTLAFAQLHDSYYPLIYRYFYYRMLDSRDAEILTSGLFHQVTEKVGLYKPGDSTFLDWLYAQAKNIMMVYILEKDAGEPTNHTTEEPSTNEDSSPSRTACLKASLALLSPDEREIIISRLIEKKSLRTTAREINGSPITTRSLQHVALLNLSGALREENCRNET